MSTDPTGLGNESCTEATKKKYINLELDRSVWCTYPAICLIDNLVFHREMVCMLCKYRKPLDIPTMLNIKMLERQRHDILWRKFK